MVRIMYSIGSKNELALEILTNGGGDCQFALWLKDVLIWGSKNGDAVRKARWSLTNFLYELGSNWNNIFIKQTFPNNIPPQVTADDYRYYSQIIVASSPENSVLEDNFIAFEFEHNLSLWFDGIFLKELFVFRIGNSIVVTSGKLAYQIELEQGMRFFEEIGNYLHDNIEKTQYTEHARLAWVNRVNISQEDQMTLLAGDISPEIRKILQPRLLLAAERTPENEYLLAARTAATCDIEASELKNLFDIIDRIKKGDISKVDHLSRKCAPVSALPEEYPHLDGYQLADKARSLLCVDDLYRVDIERILSERLGVHVLEEEFSIKVDAIAVWGDERGPTVVLNSRQNARTSTSNGRRTALAHELCHLICDRALTLPVAEVLCGQSPVSIEKRANAFAAEFLLPRRVAFRTVFNSESFEEAMVTLTAGYGVSRVVAAWQVKNSSDFDSLDLQTRESVLALLGDYTANYTGKGYAVG